MAFDDVVDDGKWWCWMMFLMMLRHDLEMIMMIGDDVRWRMIDVVMLM